MQALPLCFNQDSQPEDISFTISGNFLKIVLVYYYYYYMNCFIMFFCSELAVSCILNCITYYNQVENNQFNYDKNIYVS